MGIRVRVSMRGELQEGRVRMRIRVSMRVWVWVSMVMRVRMLVKDVD